MFSRLLVPYAILLAGLVAGPVVAEVKQAAPDTFQIVVVEHVAAPPAAVYAALPKVEQWWSSEHTYSGDAANLSLKAEPGGCFCERWKDGAVEHGHVVMLLKDQALRLESSLGPLQAKAVTGILTFVVKAEEAGTLLTVGYRVNGASASALDKDAAAVDGVLGAQVQRLKRLVETGKAS